MLRTRRHRLASGSGFFTSSLILLSWTGMPLPASAQQPSAPQPASEATVPLPPVVVEGTQAKPKAAKKAKSAKKTPSAPAQQAVPAAVTTQGSGTQGVERANEPVTGYLATQSATGTKTDTPILETPQSISVVTKDQITAQQAQTVTEALRYTPGVSIDSFGSSVFFDWIKIRGFNAPQYLDGLRLPNDTSAFAVPRIEPYSLERLEVLKGPSSGLYGQSEPGGLINMVSKRPTWSPHYEVQGTIGSFDRKEAAFDIGGPAGNGEFAYRLVGLGRISDTEIDFTEDNKLFIAPSLAWRPTKDTTITVLSQYQRIHNDGYQQYVPGQVTLLPNPFGRIPQSRYLGEPGFDKYTLEQASIGYALEHRFNSSLQFRQNARYLDVSNDMAAMRGDFMADPPFFLPSNQTLMRAPIYVDADARNFTVDNQLQADFSTGPLGHTLLVGLDYQKTISSNESRLPISPLLTPFNYLPINVFNPVYGANPIPGADMLPAFIDLHTRQEQTGIYVQDQIKLDRFTLSLTGRQDWASVETASAGFYPPAGTYERDDSAHTGRVGLNYLFDFGLSPYVNWSTSFVPNVGASVDGSAFKPTTGEGKEVGVKFMAPGSNLMFTAALFDIRQNDIVASYPLNPLLSVQTDQVRVRGYEFEVRGNVTRELEVVGGYSSLDPEITKSVVASNVGNTMPNVNLDQASLWAKYTWYDGPVAGLGLGGGIRYVGENYGDPANTIRIPSHTLFDATVSYDLGYLGPDLKGWQAQINGTNLGDTYYVASCQGALVYCGLGAGRTVLGTLRYTWDAEAR